MSTTVLLCCSACSQATRISDGQPLTLPEPGSYELRILTPTLLELTLITTKKPDPAKVEQWDFVRADGKPQLPPLNEFSVSADSKIFPIQELGFKRRVLYAPFKQRDLRIANFLYLQLSEALPQDQSIEVKNPSKKLWPASMRFIATNAPQRWSPEIHVNQVGYLASRAKKAMIGYYLGSLGEMNLNDKAKPNSDTNSNLQFKLIQAQSGKEVFAHPLTPRPDHGFPYQCYQQVLEADFTEFKTPGEYRLLIPGLGSSFPFFISDDIAGAFARTYALGIYHQRCGTANALPFTRFTHGPCHTAPAEVPDMSKKFASVNESLAKESANYKDNPEHTAPQLKNVAASLYPFVNKGKIDVSGGHHDAGDYSKYTCNSAGFIHYLVFGADVFPGAAELDNLGLPESGDGKSDVLQEVKWEADFLAKMQDADGGFYFLVYPRDREYETDVTPDHGDPQIVFPKNLAVSAAATAALAQCGSSPTFKKQFPDAAKAYLEKAKKGWAFLESAIAKYGKHGAYQKITHYGDDFMADDELAWAACELFLATGDPGFHERVKELLRPSDPAIRKWGWLRLYDAYGCAIRSYAFGARSGRLKREQLDPQLLDQCENEIAADGQDQLRRSADSAYGTSFPEETKRVRTAGWYFSSDAAFDIAVACQLDYPIRNDPRPRMLDALLCNLNYESGCNPVNVTYLTGLGWKRQREIVHQYAQNDRRVLPPTGIPLGNIQGGFGWLELYKKELGDLTFPSDGDESAPYPIYDRWGDSFNLSTEFVILAQARGLAYTAWLMAQTDLKNQNWKSAPGQIKETPNGFELASPELKLDDARIVWEAADSEPAFGKTFSPTKPGPKPKWVEAEAQLPDGRRVFGVKN